MPVFLGINPQRFQGLYYEQKHGDAVNLRYLEGESAEATQT